jgi:branched-chain amino acid transport system substrate-binding protein
MKKLLIALCGIFLLAGCGQTDTSETPQTKNSGITNSSETITIGAIAPLTGDAASLGEPIRNFYDLKISKINENGGINGKNIEIIWEDGKCNPKDASIAAQKLISIDKVNMIFSTCSGETLGIAPITEKNNVIIYTAVSTNPDVSDAGEYVFRVAPSDSGQGNVLGTYANKQGFKKIGIISEQTDYAIGVRDALTEVFSGETVIENYLSTESDFKSRITKLKASDIDALFINPQTKNKLDLVLKQLKEQKWNGNILLNEFLGDNDVIDKYVDFLNEQPSVAGANFVAPDNQVMVEFIAEYEKKFDKNPSYQNYAATIVDSLDLLKKVLENVDDTNNTEEIKNELMAQQDFVGVYGPLQFDQNGDVNIYHSLFTFNGKKFIPVTK